MAAQRECRGKMNARVSTPSISERWSDPLQEVTPHTPPPPPHLDVLQNLGLPLRLHVEGPGHLAGDVDGVVHAEALAVLRA